MKIVGRSFIQVVLKAKKKTITYSTVILYYERECGV